MSQAASTQNQRTAATPSAPVVVPGRTGDALEAWSAAELSRAARAMWTHGPMVPRRMQHLRPYICPFDKLLAHIEPGSRVLDVGCGRGLFLGLLHHAGLLATTPGAPSVGFDCNREAIVIARMMSRRASAGINVRFERRDAEEIWPGAEGDFDAVSIIDVMHHLPLHARRGVIHHAASRVRPGGVLMYKDMTQRSWRSVANSIHDLAVAREWVTYSPVASVEAWAEEAGLRLRHAEQFERLWYGHELRVFIRPEH